MTTINGGTWEKKNTRIRVEHNSNKTKTREALLRTTLECLSDIPSPNANTLGEIAVIQEELDQIDQIAIEGIKTRARIQEGEEGEKSTAFFYQKHQQNILKKINKCPQRRK